MVPFTRATAQTPVELPEILRAHFCGDLSHRVRIGACILPFTSVLASEASGVT